jgi:hypothetical protein
MHAVVVYLDCVVSEVRDGSAPVLGRDRHPVFERRRAMEGFSDSLHFFTHMHSSLPLSIPTARTSHYSHRAPDD